MELGTKLYKRTSLNKGSSFLLRPREVYNDYYEQKEKEGINYDLIRNFTGCICNYRTSHRPGSRSGNYGIWRYTGSNPRDLRSNQTDQEVQKKR